MEIIILIIGWSLGFISTFIFTLVQAYLTRKQDQGKILMETRFSTYARLLFSVKSEERCPQGSHAGVTSEESDLYNSKVEEWRKNRRVIKGIATEAFLLSSGSDLKKRLSEFISSDNPDFRVTDVESLMRNEIGIK